MHVGLGMYLQNNPDWDRYLALERGETVPPLEPNTDAPVVAEHLEEAVMAEELGFDSVWVVEHHISPYTMICSPLQLLSYIAGATKKVDLGTMVVVLPWHHPLRVAEEMTMLQYMMGEGRTPYIGFGRGLGRREYKAFGIDQSEARARFAEGIEVIKLAIGQEQFSFEGEIFSFDNTTMRPRPRDAQALLDGMHFAWGSPSSAPIGAGYGLKPIITPLKPLADYHADLDVFTRVRDEAGYAPARPRLHMHMYCHEDAAVAEAHARTYIPQHAYSSLQNYELLTPDHFKDIKGYEHYAAGGDIGELDDLVRPMLDNGIWGTPDQCIEKIQRLSEAFHPESFNLTGRYGLITHEQAMASMELFAREVLPAAHEIPLAEPMMYSTTPSAVA